MTTIDDIAVVVLILTFFALAIAIVWLQMYLRSPSGQRWRLNVRYNRRVEALIEMMDKFRF